jgi:hypothetical protein
VGGRKIFENTEKGDYRNCSNWREITLLVVISKVFNRIILDRISGILERGIRKKQAGLDPIGHVLTRSTP